MWPKINTIENDAYLITEHLYDLAQERYSGIGATFYTLSEIDQRNLDILDSRYACAKSIITDVIKRIKK